MRWLFLVVMSCALVPVARADGARDEARRLKDLGTAAFDRGQFEEALGEFEQAYKAFPSPNLRFNIGLALSKLGKTIEASEAFEAFLADATDAPEDARAFARAQLADLDQRVGKLVVASDVSGARVVVDGKPIGATPLSRVVRVEPGEHSVTVSLVGHRPFSDRVKVVAGETKQVTAHLVPVVAPSIVQPTWWERHRSSSAAAGIAIAAAGTGLYFGIATERDYADLAKTCAGTPMGCPPERIDQVERKALYTNVAFGVAGTGAIVSVLLYVFTEESARVAVVPTREGIALATRF